MIATYGKSWSDSEMNFIKENYKTKSDEEIGLALNRTKVAVTVKRTNMKLYKPRVLIYAEYIVEKGFIEMRKMIEINKAFIRMKELIKICETSENTYQKEMAIQQLKKLSGL